MTSQDTLPIAERAFAQIAARFPGLQLVLDNKAPVELAYTIPVQPGVKQQIYLNLQNNDALHFSVGPLGAGWKTIGTWSTLLGWLPGQRTQHELRNA